MMENAASITVLRSIALAVWLFWLFHYWGGIRGMRSELHKVQNTQSPLDRTLSLSLGCLIVVLLCLAIAILAGALPLWLPGQGLLLAVMGVLFSGLGLAASYHCRRHLGRFWTPEAAVQPDHQVVDTGPYGLVRHPIYTATLVMYLGFVLAFPHPLTWLLYGLLSIMYILKADEEERFLASQLPAYGEYRQRVRRRVLPGVW